MNTLTKREIVKMRLYNQGISHQTFKSASEIVSWFGAMQAQDYYGAKWAVGMRIGATDAEIEKAIAQKEIVRTWTLRGTLQFVAPEDIYWILDLVAPKIIKSIATRYLQMELDAKTLLKSNNLLAKSLEGNKALTRPELKEILAKNKIPTHELRLNFLLQRAAFDKLICLGPRRNKEFTFVLLPEWVPKKNLLSREESIRELAKRFFQSHGPASVQDFAWWSGLTLNECRQGVEMNKHFLRKELFEGMEFWMSSEIQETDQKPLSVFMLPGFDEYMLGYKDRSAAIDNQHVKHVFASGNAIFKNTIVVNGQVAGTWRRTIQKDKVMIETYLFSPMGKSASRLLEKEADRFGKFLGMEVVVQNDK